MADTTTAGDAAAPQEQGNESMLNKDKMGVQDIKSPKDLIRWFMMDPLSRWPILLFIAGIFLSLIFMIVAGIKEESIYAPGGIVALIICLYGANHFRLLMRLREQVNVFEANNAKFKKENAEMVRELNNLREAKIALAGQEERLKEVNEHNRENLIKFETIEKNLERMGSSNVAGMSSVLQTMHSLDDRLKTQLTGQMRSLYLRVFEEMEFKDDDAGMTEPEYQEFLNSLPADHRRKLQEKFTFADMAGDDNVVSIEEFSDVLDKIAQDEAEARKNR